MELVENRKTEKRIWRDCNGLFHLQVRYLPVYSWEEDGWKTIYASTNESDVLKRYYGKEWY